MDECINCVSEATTVLRENLNMSSRMMEIPDEDKDMMAVTSRHGF